MGVFGKRGEDQSAAVDNAADQVDAEAAAEQPEANPDADAGETAADADVAAEVASDAEADAEAPADASDESDVVDGLPEINAAVRPMVHPEGDASCSLYESNDAGHVLVPAAEVPAMLEHGFVLVDDEA